MKTFYYILILLLSFSFAEAQENNITVSNKTEKVIVAKDSTSTKADKKESVARSNSDIRIFLNRERKVENIKWLFPKINKAKIA